VLNPILSYLELFVLDLFDFEVDPYAENFLIAENLGKI